MRKNRFVGLKLKKNMYNFSFFDIKKGRIFNKKK